jgi:hypothetical protein
VEGAGGGDSSVCKSGESLRLAGPRLARLQAAAQRDVVEEGAVLRLVVGHENAPMARRACCSIQLTRCTPNVGSPSRVPRDARVVTLGGARWWASLEAPRTRKPAGVYRQVSAVPREGRGRPIEVGGPGWVGAGWVDRPRSASAGAKSGGVF